MGRVVVSPISIERLNAADNPFQSAFWAYVKQYSQWNASAFTVQILNDADEVEYDETLLVLSRRAALSYHIAYIPFGPVIPKHSLPVAQFLRELSKALQSYLPRYTISIRYDLPWPDHDHDQIEPILGRSLHSCRESVQPEGTACIDLKQGYEQIRLSYRERAVRNIRKALSKGVVVVEWDGREKTFEEWYEVYRQTAKRDGFDTRESAYIRRMLSQSDFAAAKRETIRKTTKRGTDKLQSSALPADNKVECHLYLAYIGKQMVGGNIVMESRYKAVYLFGSSLRIDGVSCSYVLQDYTIQKACERNLSVYDLYGISGPGNRGSHLEGLRLFKRSFGGYVRYRHPSIDFVYKFLPWIVYSRLEILRYRAKRRRQPKRITQQYAVSSDL